SQIDDAAKSVVPVINLLAQDMAAENLTETMVQSRLQDALGRLPKVTTVTAAFEHNTFRADRRLYSLVLHRAGDTTTIGHVEDRYDYSNYTYRWFSYTLLDGARWSLQTLDNGDDVPSYCVRFFAPRADPNTADPRGVVCGSLPLDFVSGAVQNLQ